MVIRRQFSTRSLFRTIALVSVLLAIVSGIARWQLHRIRYQHAMAVLSANGGTHTTESALDNYLLDDDAFEEKWKRTKYKGENTLFRRNPIVKVDLSCNSWPRRERKSGPMMPPWNDEAIGELAAFRDLREINFRGSNLTDHGLQHLMHFRRLEKIDVSGTKVTPAGLDQLRKWKPDCNIITELDWESKRSPLAYNYWLRLELGIIDQEGNLVKTDPQSE